MMVSSTEFGIFKKTRWAVSIIRNMVQIKLFSHRNNTYVNTLSSYGCLLSSITELTVEMRQ